MPMPLELTLSRHTRPVSHEAAGKILSTMIRAELVGPHAGRC